MEISLKYINPEIIEWLENEIDRISFGEVGFIFKIHEGKIVSWEKISHKKEKIYIDKENNAV